jgi:hypothetical protein
LEDVDIRSRCSLSAGRAVSLLALRAVMSLTCPLVPQESRTFRSNQLFNEDFSKNVRSNNLLEKAISYYRITEGSPVQSLD